MPTLREKAQLLRGLITGERAFTGPFYVSVDLTRRCNLNCLYCRFHSSQSNFPSPVKAPVEDMPFDVYLALLDRLAQGGRTRELIFAGEGEPVLYPYFSQALRRAKQAGLHVNLITNGTILTPDLVAELIDARLDLLTISIWASSEEEYAELCPGTAPRFHQLALDALQLVTDVKAKQGSRLPQLRLHRPLSRINFATVETAVDQALSSGCDQLTVAPVHSLKGELASHTLSAAEEKQVAGSLARMKRRLRAAKVDHNIETALQLYRIGEAVWEKIPCYAGWLHSRIRIDGSVFPCGRCDLPLGDLKESSFDDIWNGQPYREFRRTASTREGLASLRDTCLCSYCCHIRNTVKVDRIFRWIRPLTSRTAQFPPEFLDGN